jgi:CRISPR/Cas system CSM-associated protein Csm2 small subunit
LVEQHSKLQEKIQTLKSSLEKLPDENRLDSSAIGKNIDAIQKQANLLEDQIRKVSDKNTQRSEEKKKQNSSLISLESKLNETDLEIESVRRCLEKTKSLDEIVKTISRIEVNSVLMKCCLSFLFEIIKMLSLSCCNHIDRNSRFFRA